VDLLKVGMAVAKLNPVLGLPVMAGGLLLKIA